MKSIAVIPVFAAVALASSSALIPSGISSGCSNFLTTFNNDSSLATCTAPLIEATSQFGPSANSSSSPSTSAVESALSSLCSSSSACSSTTIRSQLAAFYAACTSELTTNKNGAVLRTYDVLYSIIPLSEAMCSKSDTGSYCVLDIATTGSNSTGTDDSSSSSGSSSFSEMASNLWTSATSAASPASKRDSSQQTISIVPNVTTFNQYNILFLFLSPNGTTGNTCTSCARNVLTSYISFESTVPYAPGMSASTMLSGQGALYSAVQKLCGASFLSGAAQAAGELSGGVVHSSSAIKTAAGSVAAGGVMLGAAALSLFALF
ncbi:hypothetical protein POSPLADRAFT_1076146 [Postia placenta MAD-698-R-SB12]|uniref:Uncharacterized protein n=1 Tax=Postia placenta MAD-698-R-SB12 TaxID=670580 RepID=A0A1X6MPI0_9APHY|nr:hypothetical protein POSPLADRAFT_1076146 [Postia placenta MAD-698-R-SB12]OSX58102.1 hypothetical protein POSPLADRAFT_1076146 [Postia placenta MAD-698-R-SB12]